MIREERMPDSIDPYKRTIVRAVVECEKPDCMNAFYLPEMGAFAAAERMKHMGWEVWVIPPWNAVTSYPHVYGARCPDHAQGV